MDGNFAWFIPIVLVVATLIFNGPTVKAPAAKKTTTPARAPDLLSQTLAVASFISPGAKASGAMKFVSKVPVYIPKPVKQVKNIYGQGFVIANRGSTGRSTANSLEEQIAMKDAISNSRNLTMNKELDMGLGDPRWNTVNGWVKMQRTFQVKDGDKMRNITIHFVKNKISGEVDDFKFVN